MSVSKALVVGPLVEELLFAASLIKQFKSAGATSGLQEVQGRQAPGDGRRQPQGNLLLDKTGSQNLMRTPMVFILDGCSFLHLRHFDLLKAFGHIERVVKSEKKNRKKTILLHTCATCSEKPSYIKAMVYSVHPCRYVRYHHIPVQ